MTDASDLQLEDYESVAGSRPASTVSSRSAGSSPCGEPRTADRTDTWEESTSGTTDDQAKAGSSHLITIQSYTQIFIATTEKNSSPKPSKGGRVNTTRQPKSQTREKPKTSVLSYPGGTSTREKPRTSVLSYPGGTKASSQRGNGGYCMAGSSVWRCFCGISEDYRWHSLRGKGICLLIPLLIAYIVVSITALPLIMVAAAISSIFLSIGLILYLARASTKVGVASDDDNDDTSCWGATWI